MTRNNAINLLNDNGFEVSYTASGKFFANKNGVLITFAAPYGIQVNQIETLHKKFFSLKEAINHAIKTVSN